MNVNDNELIELNPFEFNKYDEYIACVGENGGTDNESILTGFRSTVKLIIYDIKNGNGTEDELIYPLVFSIRHCIELSIKIAVEYIRDIYSIKNQNFPILDTDLHTHDIEELAGILRSLYSTDRRIKDLFELPLQYSKDYFFDKKGDVFRYEKDTSGGESLKRLNISQISISILESKFDRMYYLYSYGLSVLASVTEEYSIGSYTRDLSRNDIEAISRQLPQYSEWSVGKGLDDCKERIREKYSVSNRQISEAITYIMNNPLFASNIGIHIRLGKITDKEVNEYANYVKTFYSREKGIIKSWKNKEDGINSIRQVQEDYKRKIEATKNISMEAMRTLAAFGDMLETGDVYCERYEKHYKHFENSEITRDYLMNKIVTLNFAKKVINGMELCGQQEYLNLLKHEILALELFS